MKFSKESPLTLALIAGIGMFLSTLDSGIINIAIPSLIKAFNSTLPTIIWTVTLYTLILSTTILLFGHLADRLGRMRIYAAGLILFGISSLLCGAANSTTELIVFRGLQGLSAAMLQATGIAIITTRLKGNASIKAMGVMGTILGLGPLLGPTVGGLILSLLDWRWIFWINIPICILGLLGCKYLPSFKEELHKTPIHYFNMALLAIALFSFLILMNFLSNNNPNYLLPLIVAIVFLIIYLISDLKSKHPAIPLKLFKQLRFTAPILGIIAFGGATALAFMLPPLYLVKLRGFPPWQVGFITLSSAAGLVVVSRIAAKLAHRIGTLKPMLAGLSIMVIMLIALSEMGQHTSLYIMCILLVIYGAGGALYQTPCYLNLTGQFSAKRQAFITSLTRMVQNLGIAFESSGAALLISLKTGGKGNDLLRGIQHSWLLGAAFAALALITILFNKFYTASSLEND